MQAQEFIFEDDEDYRIPHRAPMHDSGSPLYDVTGTYPDDIYGPKAIQYYGTREPWDSRSIRVIQLSRNKPNQTIQIFRAVPKEVKSNTINPGDWVTASKEYAAQHGKGLGKYKLLSKIVPAKTLFTNGDSIHEWGYDPGGAAVNESLSSLISQDQSERNAYSQFVKSQAGGDWTKGAAMYAKVKKRPSNDIFGEKERLNQFMKMKFDFTKFTNDEWDNYWLLAQHCDFNRNFQQQVLAIIKKYQGVDNSHYHYLADRISCGTNGTQKYGTQDICTIDTQPVAESKLNELRDRMYQYIKSIVPTWPDYVVQDLLYANRGKGNTGNDGIPIKNDILDLLKAEGLTPNTKWQLIPNMKFSMDMWAEHTLRKLKGRVGGSSDMGMNIPRDAERHTTQAALAQQQGGVRKEPVIIIKTPQGYELLEGWHRTIQHFAMYPTGYVGPAYVAQSNQPVAEDNASPTKISFKVKKGRGRFATEMIVNGQQAGVYQYDANTGRSIAEVFPEFRSQGLGKILVLHAIYTAAKLGLDFQEDESRTAAYDNVLDSLSSNGYIVDDDGYWYVTGEGEQYLQQALKNKAQPVAEDKMISNGQPVENITVYHGGKQPITKFNIPPYGVFFTPHKDWAEQYGTVVTAAKIQSPNVYIVSSDGKGFDNEVLDALFRRDYASLTKIIKLLMSRGYTALQTQTDTEMLCVFPGTNIQIVDSSDEPVAENFADGKGPGRPGDSGRHGIPKNATMAELEKASHSAGRKGQLARWQLNMRRGKAELSEIKQRLDAKCWQGKRKEGTKIKGGIRVNNCVPVSETGIKKPQLKTYAARVKLKQSGYTNIVDATVSARNPEMARRLLHQLYGGNSSVVGQPREIK